MREGFSILLKVPSVSLHGLWRLSLKHIVYLPLFLPLVIAKFSWLRLSATLRSSHESKFASAELEFLTILIDFSMKLWSWTSHIFSWLAFALGTRQPKEKTMAMQRFLGLMAKTDHYVSPFYMLSQFWSDRIGSDRINIARARAPPQRPLILLIEGAGEGACWKCYCLTHITLGNNAVDWNNTEMWINLRIGNLWIPRNSVIG